MSRPPIAALLPLVPPPVVDATCFGLGLLLNWMMPWSPGWMRDGWAHRAGWIVGLAAMTLGLSGVMLLLLRRTTVIRHSQPTRLITDGPFVLSRNPMYVALTTAYVALAALLARL